MNRKAREALETLIEHNWDAEQEDYEFHRYSKEDNHIFNDLQLLKAWLAKQQH